jgi:hypothetical protein
MDNKKCPHGLDVDPQTGEHIFPQGNTYTIKEHDDGKTYTVIDHQEEPKPKPKPKPIVMNTDELIAEARKLFPRQEPKQEEPKQTKFDKQIEQSKKQWEEYYRNNPSKIRYNIFEEIEKAFDY